MILEKGYAESDAKERGGLIINKRGLDSATLETLPIIKLNDGPEGSRKVSSGFVYTDLHAANIKNERSRRLASPDELDFDRCVDILTPGTVFHFCDIRQLPGIMSLGLLSYALRFPEQFMDVNYVTVDQGSFVDRYSLAYDTWLSSEGSLNDATVFNIQTYHDSNLLRIGRHKNLINSIIASNPEAARIKDPSSNMSFTQNGRTIEESARFNSPSVISVFNPFLAPKGLVPGSTRSFKLDAIGTDMLKYPSDNIFLYELPTNNPLKPVLVLRDVELTVVTANGGTSFLDNGGGLDYEVTLRDRARPSSIKYLEFNLDFLPINNDPTNSSLFEVLNKPLDELKTHDFSEPPDDLQSLILELKSKGYSTLLEYYRSFNVPIVFSWRLDHEYLNYDYADCMDTALGVNFGMGPDKYSRLSTLFEDKYLSGPSRDLKSNYTEYLDFINEAGLQDYLSYKKTQNLRVFYLI
jgi:hypothetical protein